jgi:hypothetical protein
MTNEALAKKIDKLTRSIKEAATGLETELAVRLVLWTAFDMMSEMWVDTPNKTEEIRNYILTEFSQQQAEAARQR